MKSTIHNTLYAILIALVLLILPQAECIAATLTITANNGSVTITPDKAQYDYGELVQLIPKPKTGYYFTGWGGDARGKSLALNLAMDSDKAIIANFGAWRPPIGIPKPEFGIFETYRMYDDPAKRNPALSYIQNAEGGYYTHYVDKNAPGATNTSNDYGTIAKPRLTIPADLPAGSVAEVHSGYSSGTGTVLVTGHGTEAMPIFVRGIALSDNPFTRKVRIEGTYMVFDGIEVAANTATLYVMAQENTVHKPNDSHHIAVRNSVSRSTGQGPGGINVGGAYYYEGIYSHDVVFYNNSVHDLGNIESEMDEDAGGAAVSGSYYVWYVDNVIHTTSGSGVQISGSLAYPNHVYIGRNHIYNTRQAGVGIKKSSDVIISQNTIHDIVDTDWSPSKGVGWQYSPERVWILFNDISRSATGVRSASGLGPEHGRNTYVIGNVIHHIYPMEYTPGASGMSMNNGPDLKHIYANVIHDVNGIGIVNEYYTSRTDIANNIFSDITGLHVNFNTGYPTAANSDIYYNLFDESARITWANAIVRDVASMQTLGECAGCLEADPLFVDAANGDFRLQPTSPAIGAATSSGTVQEVFDTFETLYGIDIRKDFEGSPRTEPWDIGAYEYSLSEVILGDVNADTEITAYDAALAARLAVGLDELTAEKLAIADVSGDGEVTAFDAALIAQRAVGLIDRFPVEG